MIEIIAQPLTKKAFAPFGDVLELRDTPDKMINQDMCGRHHDLADLDFADGRAGISLFDAVPKRFGSGRRGGNELFLFRNLDNDCR